MIALLRAFTSRSCKLGMQRYAVEVHRWQVGNDSSSGTPRTRARDSEEEKTQVERLSHPTFPSSSLPFRALALAPRSAFLASPFANYASCVVSRSIARKGRETEALNCPASTRKGRALPPSIPTNLIAKSLLPIRNNATDVVVALFRAFLSIDIKSSPSPLPRSISRSHAAQLLPLPTRDSSIVLVLHFHSEKRANRTRLRSAARRFFSFN
jgi:hypothetical protein